MTTYVLIHGSRHGGWCWTRVAKLLRKRGHDVYTPTLSGNGERSHLRGVGPINLDTHIEDVRAVLFYEDLHNVILVAHSYAGIVATGVAEVSFDRLAHLVYLDAIMPVAGECHLDLAGAATAARLRAEMVEDEFGWKLPAGGSSAGYFEVTEPADAAWLEARLTDQSAETYSQPLRSDAASRRLPRTFMQCMHASSLHYSMIERIRRDPDIAVVELPAAHDVMITAPELLVEELNAVARLQVAGQPH
jgi:pimeloyl-ACP methyl ester carboxylesterase